MSSCVAACFVSTIAGFECVAMLRALCDIYSRLSSLYFFLLSSDCNRFTHSLTQTRTDIDIRVLFIVKRFVYVLV